METIVEEKENEIKEIKEEDSEDDEENDDEDEESYFVARFDIKKMTKKDKDRYVSEIERIVTAMEGYEMD